MIPRAVGRSYQAESLPAAGGLRERGDITLRVAVDGLTGR
jgi:hypothetical protein